MSSRKSPKKSQLPIRTVQSLTRTTPSETTVSTVTTTRLPPSLQGSQSSSRYGQPRREPPSCPGPCRETARGRAPGAAGPSGATPRIPAPGYSSRGADFLGTPSRPRAPRTLPMVAAAPRPPAGAVPKKVTTKSSKTTITPGKRVQSMKTTTTTFAPPAPQPALPEGRYTFPMQQAPHPATLKKFSSPPQLRSRMERNLPQPLRGYQIPPDRLPRDARQLQRMPQFKDVLSGSLDVRHGRPQPYGPMTREESYFAPAEQSFLNYPVSGTPPRSPGSPGTSSDGSPRARGSPAPPRPTPPRGSPKTPLQKDTEAKLMQEAARSPGMIVNVSGSRVSPTRPHTIMTPQGPVQAQTRVITEKTLERSPGMQRISRHMVGVERETCMQAKQMELDTERLEPGPGQTPGSPVREVISVSSSVAIGGGVKEITTNVIYEATKDKDDLDPKEVSKLIDEEAHDVNETMKLQPIELKVTSPKTYGIRKRDHELFINASSISRLEQSVVYPIPTPDQEQEEMQPELMATIMHTEEQGLQMGAQPVQLCDYLFPNAQDDTVEVTSAAPAPLQDVVVPRELPANFLASALNTDLERAVFAVEQSGAVRPKDNAYSENVQQKTLLNNVAKRGRGKRKGKVPDLREELPPWTVNEMQTIYDLVGAEPQSVLIATLPDDSSQGVQDRSDAAAGIEYILRLEPPSHVSRVQLRGSQKPPWFPEIPELVKTVKHPMDAINAAYQSVQPKIFNEDSFLVV